MFKLLTKRAVFVLLLSGIVLSEVAASGENMKLTSPAFLNNQLIPKKYTCQGEDINPPLAIADLPVGTKSLVLIVDDPDAPGETWVHWVVYNIPAQSKILENSIPGLQGGNDFRRLNYGGPCPPSGTHRYFFKIYALDSDLNFIKAPSKTAVEGGMKDHVLGKAELIGLYKKER